MNKTASKFQKSIILSALSKTDALICGGQICNEIHTKCCVDTRRSFCCNPELNRNQWMMQISGLAFGIIGAIICIVLIMTCCAKFKRCFGRSQSNVSPSSATSNGISHISTQPPSYQEFMSAQSMYEEPPEYYKLYPNLLRENPTNENSQECNVMTSQTNEAFESDDVTIRVETSMTSHNGNHATTSPSDNRTTMTSLSDNYAVTTAPGAVAVNNSTLVVTDAT